MKLRKGFEAEYKRRHDLLWPELQSLLRSKCIHDYSIFLEAETGVLFGILKLDDSGKLHELREEPVMMLWWDYMKDIMDSNTDHSPVTINLQEVFYLP